MNLFSAIVALLCCSLVLAQDAFFGLSPRSLADLPEALANIFSQQQSDESSIHRQTQQVTWNQTKADASQPTASPTESPAPSPSPSEAPTIRPTTTPQPTAKPSSTPTESPAPSPSPSEAPTEMPTRAPTMTPSAQPTTTPYPTQAPSSRPSDSPSDTPSRAPSMAPTVSVQPSMGPTETPSLSPSTAPSISSAPSTMPSVAPSTSAMPSGAPTFISTEEGMFNVTLDLEKSLSDKQLSDFATATQMFIADTEVPDGKISSVTVDVVSQHYHGRRLQSNNTTTTPLIKSGLEIQFTATAEYHGTGEALDFQAFFDDIFELDDTRQLWIIMLGNENTIYLPLRPTPVGLSYSETTNYKSDSAGTLSSGTYVLVILVSVMAFFVAVVASVYSIRYHKMTMRGTELRSPGRVGQSSSSDSTDGKVYKQTYAIDPNEMQVQFDTSTQEIGVQPMSPNTMEKGRGRMHARPSETSHPYNNNNNNMYNNYHIGRSHQDPPTEAERQRSQQSALVDMMDTPKSESSSAFTSHQGQNAITLNHKSHVPGAIPATLPQGQESPSEMGLADHELLLTKSAGGTLGAVAVDGSYHGATTPSDFSSNVKGFFSNVMGGGNAKSISDALRMPNQDDQDARYTQNDGALGARPNVVKNGSYDSGFSRRAGLYDVFAPAGPIGIVVDTTKEGPAVHSLKNTSPMLGLINPGDLIVGLDDEDTRSMTAATLTRLMARKASQKERKITLLACDNY